MLWTSTALAAALIAATAARAETAVSSASAGSQPAQIEEVVVTAQRRAENLQRVPIAISAYDAKTLQQRQLANVADIAQTAPNVQYSAGASGTGSSANIFIRGIGQVDFVPTTDPGVGTYIDGVYLARTTGAALDLGDVERVEVLRGPQGTLFGRNSIGGALNITTQQPTNDFSGRAEVTVGNLDRYDERLMVNAPIIDDKLALRINALNSQNDGYGRATLNDGERIKLGAQNEFAGRAELLAKPTDTFQILVSVDGTHSRGATDPVAMVAYEPTAQTASFNATAPIPIGPGDVTGNLNNLRYSVRPTEDFDVLGGSVTLSQKLGDITLKSISAYRWQSLTSGQDYDGSAANFLDQFNYQTAKQFSQEFQVLGNSLGGALSWVAGLYYFTESNTFDSRITELGAPIRILTDNGAQSYAGYGQATYHVTDKLSLTVGARYTDERKTISATTDIAGAVVVPQTGRAARFSAFSPKGALEYQATSNIMTYASVSRGFRSGGFNGRPFSLADLTPYAPETTTSYEVGTKTEWFDKRLRLNLAGYYTDYKKIQLTATTERDGQFTVVTGNAASAQIYGFEAEFEARPVDPLTLFGGVGYTNDTLQQNPGFSFGARTLPNTPKVTASLGFNYSAEVGDYGEAGLTLNATYRSSSLPQYNPTPTIAGYTLLNGQLSFTPKGGRWKLALYGKNLTDTRYWVFAENTGIGPTIAWFGRPREFGATVGYNF